MKKTILIILIAFLPQIGSTTPSVQFKDTSVENIDKAVAAIEAYRSSHPDKQKKYIIKETKSKLDLQEVPLDAPVKDSEAAYYVLLDDSGHVLSHSEEPISLSGDWYELGTHYFDNNERTIMYKFTGGYFNECNTSLLKTTRQYYFNSNFQITKKTISYTDEANKPVDEKNCGEAGKQDKDVIQSSYSNIKNRIARNLVEYKKNRTLGEQIEREMEEKHRQAALESDFYFVMTFIALPTLIYALFVSVRRRRSKHDINQS